MGGVEKPMRKNRLLSPSSTASLAFAVFLLLLPGFAGSVEPDSVDPQTLLREGQRLVEENCGDCMGATREGLELGIQKIEEAMKLGIVDLADAYRSLGEAYNDLAFVYTKSGSSERREALRTQQTYYQRLVQLEPEDTEALYELAGTYHDERRLELLRRLLEIDPDHLDARFNLGQALVSRGAGNQELVQDGAEVEGLEMMRTVFDRALAERLGEQFIVFYGETLESALRDHGLDDEADEVARRRVKRIEMIRARYGHH